MHLRSAYETFMERYVLVSEPGHTKKDDTNYVIYDTRENKLSVASNTVAWDSDIAFYALSVVARKVL